MKQSSRLVRFVTRGAALFCVLVGLFFCYAAASLGRHTAVLVPQAIRHGQVSVWDLVWCGGTVVLVIVSWAFLFGLPPKLWNFPDVGEIAGRRSKPVVLQLMLVVLLALICGIVVSWIFPAEEFSVESVDGHTALMRVSDPDPFYYYAANGRKALERHGEFGRTTWRLDGTVKSQERYRDSNGNPVDEVKSSPPWWWGVRDETATTAPWWTGKPLPGATEEVLIED